MKKIYIYLSSDVAATLEIYEGILLHSGCPFELPLVAGGFPTNFFFENRMSTRIQNFTIG